MCVTNFAQLKRVLCFLFSFSVAVVVVVVVVVVVDKICCAATLSHAVAVQCLGSESRLS